MYSIQASIRNFRYNPLLNQLIELIQTIRLFGKKLYLKTISQVCECVYEVFTSQSGYPLRLDDILHQMQSMLERLQSVTLRYKVTSTILPEKRVWSWGESGLLDLEPERSVGMSITS